MELLERVRGADGERTRFHAAHMAANLWRTFSSTIWILTLVSSSRTRIYPPNEGKEGGTRIRVACVAQSGLFSRCCELGEILRALKARPRIAKNREKFANI